MTECKSPVPLDASTTPEDLIIKADYADFLERTHLDKLRPEQRIEFTVPGRYQDLLAHIGAHQHYLEQRLGQAVPCEEAVTSWYDNVYLPLVRLIREKGLLKDFPQCQIVRPRKDDEVVEQPEFFEGLLSALGADPIDYYPLEVQCCGGSLILTSRRAALSMVRNLLQTAADRDADVIATACPLCQVNLECYQKQVNQEFGTELSVPVMYFTQLVGLAMGIEPQKLGTGKELVSTAGLTRTAARST